MGDLEVFAVSDAIVCLRRRSYLTCSYLVRGAAGLVLIDAGMSSEARDVEGALRFISAEFSEIRAVLLTHWHNDHSAGAARTAELAFAEVYYHAGEAEYLALPGKPGRFADRLSALVPEWGPFVIAKGLLKEGPPAPVRATGFVEDGQLLFGEFVVVHTPGHTPGHVSYLHRPTGALFAGDALAVVGGEVRLMARSVTPDRESARASVLRCLGLEVELLCPGHRRPLTEDVRPSFERLRERLERDAAWPIFG
jgi:glyoxylase-like metal-dependent hydrolase (beta-lactamase superfamily II)